MRPLLIVNPLHWLRAIADGSQCGRSEPSLSFFNCEHILVAATKAAAPSRRSPFSVASISSWQQPMRPLLRA